MSTVPECADGAGGPSTRWGGVGTPAQRSNSTYMELLRKVRRPRGNGFSSSTKPLGRVVGDSAQTRAGAEPVAGARSSPPCHRRVVGTPSMPGHLDVVRGLNP